MILRGLLAILLTLTAYGCAGQLDKEHDIATDLSESQSVKQDGEPVQVEIYLALAKDLTLNNVVDSIESGVISAVNDQSDFWVFEASSLPSTSLIVDFYKARIDEVDRGSLTRSGNRYCTYQIRVESQAVLVDRERHDVSKTVLVGHHREKLSCHDVSTESGRLYRAANEDMLDGLVVFLNSI